VTPAGSRPFWPSAENSTTVHSKVQEPMTDLILILTTMPDDDRADTLARTLVDERLAACVNVHGPMVSTYRWKGIVEREAERQVVIKTTRGRLVELETRLRALHPYELPEFVVLNAEAGDAYGRWTAETTRSG
jgi:periplasmic divalent cation tolerance protein